MASIQITKANTYAVFYKTAQGQRSKKTFKALKEAKQFIKYIDLTPEFRKSTVTAKQILLKYREEVSINKKSAKSESLRIGRFLQAEWANKKMSALTTKDIQSWLNGRRKDPGASRGSTISDGTIKREGETLKSIFAWAVRMGLITENPFRAVELPKEPDHRERTASEKEVEMLQVAAGWDGSSPIGTELGLVICMFMFACQTGMRSGELIRMEEAWIKGRVVRIPKEATKTDAHREVALSLEALRLLDLARAYTKGNPIFGCMLTDGTRDGLFRKIRDRAGLGPVKDSQGRIIEEGLRFHDSRATFATWAASPDPKTGAPRLEVLALARQTGHKDLKKLMRYYRAKAESLASRLD